MYSKWLTLLSLVSASIFVGCGLGGIISGTNRNVESKTRKKDTNEVRLEVVKFRQWKEALQKYRGKVVVVDVWASWCLPCKQGFPHLVELHKKYAKDGLLCMSVSLDDTEKRDIALAFLKSKQATFPNYLLDEGEKGWDKLDIKSIPAVFVFGRDGKLARRFTGDDPDNQFTYADVESFVNALLREKVEMK